MQKWKGRDRDIHFCFFQRYFCIFWYNVITTVYNFCPHAERNSKSKKTDWLPTRDIVGQMSGRRRCIAENGRIKLIEEYYLVMVEPSSRLRWGTFSTFVQLIILNLSQQWFVFSYLRIWAAWKKKMSAPRCKSLSAQQNEVTQSPLAHPVRDCFRFWNGKMTSTFIVCCLRMSCIGVQRLFCSIFTKY